MSAGLSKQLISSFPPKNDYETEDTELTLNATVSFSFHFIYKI